MAKNGFHPNTLQIPSNHFLVDNPIRKSVQNPCCISAVLGSPPESPHCRWLRSCRCRNSRRSRSCISRCACAISQPNTSKTLQKKLQHGNVEKCWETDTKSTKLVSCSVLVRFSPLHSSPMSLVSRKCRELKSEAIGLSPVLTWILHLFSALASASVCTLQASVNSSKARNVQIFWSS